MWWHNENGPYFPLLSPRQYWFKWESSLKTKAEAQALCQSFHPKMALAEFNEPGEKTGAKSYFGNGNSMWVGATRADLLDGHSPWMWANSRIPIAASDLPPGGGNNPSRFCAMYLTFQNYLYPLNCATQLKDRYLCELGRDVVSFSTNW